MSRQLATYSGKDLNFTLYSPLYGTIQAAGISANGVENINIRMAVTQTVIENSMDGAAVVSAVPGDNGEIEIQVWQTSTLHQELLAWYNLEKAARDVGDVSNWATSRVLIQNIVDGSQHEATGVAPSKVPDKLYGKQAQVVSWVLMAANIVSQ